MKTEIELPEELLTDLGSIAERRRTSVDSVIENTLRQGIYDRDSQSPSATSPRRAKEEQQNDSRKKSAIIGAALLLAAGVSGFLLSALSKSSWDNSNAQNIAIVFEAAAEAGADFGDVTDLKSAIQTLEGGVYGSDDFETTKFQVSGLTEKDAEAAAEYIESQLDSDKARAKRNAQNLASVCSSAIAAGADLSHISDLKSAIQLLIDGVHGSDSFETTKFQVPSLTDEEVEPAANYLFWDSRRNVMHYLPIYEDARLEAMQEAEKVESAIGSFAKSLELEKAREAWSEADTEDERYALIRLFMAPEFPQDCVPHGYAIDLSKVAPESLERYYFGDDRSGLRLLGREGESIDFSFDAQLELLKQGSEK